MSVASPATPLDGIDLVAGVVHLWAGESPAEVDAGEEAPPVLALRADALYPSPGVGRLVLATAFARAWEAGRIEPGERTLLTRGRDLGDQGVLASLGAGLDPTWRDLIVIALALEDREATARLSERLGQDEIAAAASTLGLSADAVRALPVMPPQVSAREAATAALALPARLGSAGLALVLTALRDGRYRWRARTRLPEDWEVAASGSRRAAVVEEVALWRTARGFAAAAVAWTEVADAWMAEYALGDAFPRVVESFGPPLPLLPAVAGR